MRLDNRRMNRLQPLSRPCDLCRLCRLLPFVNNTVYGVLMQLDIASGCEASGAIRRPYNRHLQTFVL